MSAQSSRLPPSRSGSASYIYLRNSRNLFVRINVKGAFKEATKSGACSFVLQHFVGVLAALKSLKSLIVPLNTAFQNQDLFNLSSIHSTLKPPLDDATRSLSLSLSRRARSAWRRLGALLRSKEHPHRHFSAGLLETSRGERTNPPRVTAPRRAVTPRIQERTTVDDFDEIFGR